MEDLFNVGVKALIRNKDGKVLVLKLNNHEMESRVGWNGQDMWDIPGGRIKKGSNAPETLEKEVHEETGRKILSTKFLTSVFASTRLKNEFYDDIGLILFVYDVEIDEGAIILNPENDLYEWVSPADAATKLSTKYPPEFCDRIKNL